jgi:hypothetical protein
MNTKNYPNLKSWKPSQRWARPNIAQIFNLHSFLRCSARYQTGLNLDLRFSSAEPPVLIRPKSKQYRKQNHLLKGGFLFYWRARPDSGLCPFPVSHARNTLLRVAFFHRTECFALIRFASQAGLPNVKTPS